MDFSIDSEVPIVRLRAFRAIDDRETCLKFCEGHQRVLSSIGVTSVTSSVPTWIDNPLVYVFIVESLDRQKVYGGARIHLAGNNSKLPIAEAIEHDDPKINELIEQFQSEGIGEGCGLWNSREIAGYGIGSIFLSRTAVAISKLIGIKRLLALCAPYTVGMCQKLGYVVENSVGNEGKFIYPKEDLIATAMIINDVDCLETADEEHLSAINEIRDNCNIVRVEELRNKKIEIHYEFEIFKHVEV